MTDAVTSSVPITLTINGRQRRVEIQPHHTLLEVLRDDLGLTGAKACCLVGECGACTVMLNGRSVDSCLVLGAEADGGEVLTVEGLAVGGHLDGLQQAFLETGAAQCGFCIPGQLMAAHALLGRTAHPSRAEVEEGLAGNYCRCAGYEQILEAVLLTAERGMTAAAELGGDVTAAAPPGTTDPAAVPDASVAPQ